MDTPKFLNESQVSAITGRAVQTLRNDRSLRQGIPFVKFRRSVRYSLEDVMEFLNQHRVETRDFKVA